MEDATYYWEIVERDGTITKIPPASVSVVQKRLGNGDPIHTRTRSIPANQITSFHITAERYSETPLIEAAAQAFKEPILVKQGSILFAGRNGETKEMKYSDAVHAKWVKMAVPMERWARYYSASPSYKLLGELNGMAEIAFIKPTHLIDVNKTPYCTDEEIAQLTRS